MENGNGIGLRSLAENARKLVTGGDEPEQEPQREERRDDGDNMWNRVGEASHIAPVHGRPTLEPADKPWEVSMLAGWGDPADMGRGQDALNGADKLVRGEIDGAKFLTAEAPDGGPVLDLVPGETIYGNIDHREEIGHERRTDWCSHL